MEILILILIGLKIHWTISGGKARRDGIAAGGNSPITKHKCCSRKGI
jgi:hypothetical protein